jgi:hypothetical protein
MLVPARPHPTSHSPATRRYDTFEGQTGWGTNGGDTVGGTLSAADLERFRGGSLHHRHHLGGCYSEGVRFLAEKGNAWWLVGAILSFQRELLASREPFQVWTYRKLTGDRAVLEMTDGQSESTLLRKYIEGIDFPLSLLELYFADNTLILPSER